MPLRETVCERWLRNLLPKVLGSYSAAPHAPQNIVAIYCQEPNVKVTARYSAFGTMSRIIIDSCHTFFSISSFLPSHNLLVSDDKSLCGSEERTNSLHYSFVGQHLLWHLDAHGDVIPV